MLYFSLTAIATGFIVSPPAEAFAGLLTLITSPTQLTMDAFHVGGVGGAFLNVGLVGLCSTGVLAISHSKLSGVSLMAFFLTYGFSFFGMNILNIWPCILGTYLFTRQQKVHFAAHVNTALFSTSLSPFVSEIIWRYPLFDGLPCEFLLRILAAFAVGGLAGFLMPILCTHSPNLHKGYSLYNAAAVAGYIGVMLYAVMYQALNVSPPSNATPGDSNPFIVNTYMIFTCAGLILAGFFFNEKSFRGYNKLFFCSGYRTDFSRTLGIPITMIHIGFFGLYVTLYYNIIGAPMNGPTLGSILCLLAVAPCGAHLLNVMPILFGYALASQLFHFNLNAQSIVVGVSFACALCQIAGHFGAICGVFAGMLHAALVSTVVSFHAGFCLYNGGFTSGICAIILVPILEHFFQPTDRLHLVPHLVKPKDHRTHPGHHGHGAQYDYRHNQPISHTEHHAAKNENIHKHRR